MSIEKRLRESFSEITPPTDNGTIVRNVIERAENMDKNNERKKRRLNRTAVTIIAAAAVLATATVSVGAATGWSFNNAFSQANNNVVANGGAYYETVYSTDEAQQTTAGTETTLPVSQAEPFDYLSGGKELDLWYSFDDFKLNIKGICADDFMAYVLYDIIFDEDFDYSPKAGWTAWQVIAVPDAVDESLDEQPELGMVTSFDDNIISQEGNILHCYTMPSMSPEYSWEGKTLTLDFMKVSRYVPTAVDSDDPNNGEEILSFGDDGLHVEIPLDFKLFERKTYEINQPVDLSMNENNRIMYGDDSIGTVKYFGVSPLSWRAYVEADTSKFEKGGVGYYYLDLVISDDEGPVELTEGVGYMWSDDNGEGVVGLFAQPVDPADITSVSICGQTFELK